MAIASLGLLDHHLILSGACCEEPRHESRRDRIARIGLRPQAERLAFLLEVAGHLPVVNRHDEEAIAVGRVIAQLVGFARALFAEDVFAASAVRQAQQRMRNREIWINLDRAFEQRDRRWRPDRAIRRAVRLQRVERGALLDSSSGVECCRTVASDSPTRVLNVRRESGSGRSTRLPSVPPGAVPGRADRRSCSSARAGRGRTACRDSQSIPRRRRCCRCARRCRAPRRRSMAPLAAGPSAPAPGGCDRRERC